MQPPRSSGAHWRSTRGPRFGSLRITPFLRTTLLSNLSPYFPDLLPTTNFFLARKKYNEHYCLITSSTKQIKTKTFKGRKMLSEIINLTRNTYCMHFFQNNEANCFALNQQVLLTHSHADLAAKKTCIKSTTQKIVLRYRMTAILETHTRTLGMQNDSHGRTRACPIVNNAGTEKQILHFFTYKRLPRTNRNYYVGNRLNAKSACARKTFFFFIFDLQGNIFKK